MKRILLVVALLAGCSTEHRPPTAGEPAISGEIAIIPQPASIKRMRGSFSFNADTEIVAVGEAERWAAEFLSTEVQKRIPDVVIRITSERGRPGTIELTEVPSAPGDSRNDSAYRLVVTPDAVKIDGSSRGMFYGVQSLLQLIPANAALPVQLPAAEIDDRPRFEYRGMHLDVARHFMDVEFVKRYIDHLARYKLNYFHWHLTDDQGWRIEIRRYPKLTEKGSVRAESALSKANEPYRGNGKPVEGFYTQEMIREVVEHARSRHVTIVPEIDMPGHMSAALAAYPEFGCLKNHSYRVKTAWGAFPDILCPTEETFQFIDNVFDEVTALFPDSPFIHIGGDEVRSHEQWRASKAVQQLKAVEGLKSEREVEGYFIRRVGEMVAARGRKAMGWDEVLDSVPAPGLTVMAWQDADRGKKAAALGHSVVMAPWQSTYFDHLPGDLGPERVALGDPVKLESVYHFDPAPRDFGAPAKWVIGGQGCLWTEFIYTPSDAEYMLFPRLLALSESLWTPSEAKNLGEFYKRMSMELARLDQAGTPFFIPPPFGFTDRRFRPNDRASLELIPPVDGASIRYTLDGSDPQPDSPEFRMPMPLDLSGTDTAAMKIVVVLPSGRQSTVFEAKFSRSGTVITSAPIVRTERPVQSFEPMVQPTPDKRQDAPSPKSKGTPTSSPRLPGSNAKTGSETLGNQKNSN